MTKGAALKKLCGLIGRGKLMGSDFADIKAWKVERPFPQDDSGGVLIQFTISHHALGHISPAQEKQEALEVLLSGQDQESTD